MKYIKTKKLFEAVDTQRDLDDIKDICLELEDEGFVVSIDEGDLGRLFIPGSREDIDNKERMRQRLIFTLRIYKPTAVGFVDSNGQRHGGHPFNRPPFKYDQVKEVVDRLREYLGDGFMQSYIFGSGIGDWMSFESYFLKYNGTLSMDTISGVKITFKI